MSDTKLKIIPNPDRNTQAPYKPYVPQYQVHGKDPQQYQGAETSGDVKVARPQSLPTDNPRAKRAPLRQPYAEAIDSPIGKGPPPNVGNNMEHTWSSVDGDIVDDISVDQDHEMIDNNDLVTDQALGYPNGLTADDISPSTQRGTVTLEEVMDEPTFHIGSDVIDDHRSAILEIEKELFTTETQDLLSTVSSLEDDNYLLIVSGIAICSGPKEEIEEQTRSMVFGDHEICDGNPVEIDDIVIIKRIKVKVGLFLE